MSLRIQFVLKSLPRALKAAGFSLGLSLLVAGCLSGSGADGNGKVTNGGGSASPSNSGVQPVATPPASPGSPATPVSPTSPASPISPGAPGTPSAPPAPAPVPAPSVSVGGTITTVAIADRDNQSLANRVVTFGHPFVAGHAAKGVVATYNGQALPTQVDVKRRHPDGSVRHAVLSVVMPASVSAARADLELRAADAMPDAGGALAVATALAGGFDFVLEVTEGGQTYRASAAELLRAQASRWLDGAIASEYRVSGPLKSGAAAHPVFEAMFDVRFFSATSARVSVVFENALANASRGERTASFRIVDNRGRELFAQANVYVPAHARFRKVFDWGTQRTTRLHVAPKLAYLVGSRAVPRYDTTKTLDPQAIADMESLRSGGLNEIFGNGPIVSYMPTTGGRSDIGLLPQWDAVALYTGDPRATDVSFAAAESSASFPVHLRDPATRKPFSIDRHPTVSIGWWGNRYSSAADSIPDCATPCVLKESLGDADPRRTTKAIYDRIHQPDTAHQPSLGYTAYLLSGDPFYLDELHFWAAYDLIVMSPAYRGNASGLLKDEQGRAQAWSLRNLAYAAFITPDAMAEERDYYEAKLASNLAWYNANAVDSNPFGFWGEVSNVVMDGGRPQPGFATNVRSMTSPWQVDYLIGALDVIDGMGYTDAARFRNWLSKLTVARFGGTLWPRADATAYQIAVRWIPAGCGLLSTPQSNNGCPATFPVYNSFAEMHQATFVNATQPTSTSPSCTMCYEANARVALAAAARAGVPGARTAHDALVADINAAMASLGRDAYLRDPTWLIVP